MEMDALAIRAKEDGDVAFRESNWGAAITKYSAGISATRDSPTRAQHWALYLNRAAAYLKIGKNQEAERDCSRVIAWDPRNAKAWFRRGEAYVALTHLRKALTDFQEALKLQPTNPSILKAVDNLASRLEIKEHSHETRVRVEEKTEHHLAQDQTPPRRRRVPIQIIDASSSASSIPAEPKPTAPKSEDKKTKTVDTLLKPVFSRKLSANEQDTSSTPEPASSNPPPLNAFQKAKQTRESQRPSRVGGGIFRASGNNTIFKGSTNTNGPASEPAKPSQSAFPTTPQDTTTEAPKTLLDLVRIWHKTTDPEEQYKLIMSVSAQNYPALFKTSLEPSFLAAIMSTFLSITKKNEASKTPIIECLNTFTTVARFETVLLFLSTSEKEIARELWDILGTSAAVGQWLKIL